MLCMIEKRVGSCTASALAIEVGVLKDDAQNEILVIPFSNWIKSTNSLKVSLSTYPEDYSLKIF